MSIFYNNSMVCLSSDLACERYRADLSKEGVNYKKDVCKAGVWERIEISSVAGAKSIGRPMGSYDTLTVDIMDTLDRERIYNASEEIAGELRQLFTKLHIIPNRLLVVGLGNPSLTPDSVGSKTACRVKATMHIREMDEKFFLSLGCSEIAVITPNVKSVSGMDAVTQAVGICERIKPNAVIAIDSLAAISAERLGKTVQMSSSGIVPGSGVGNHKTALDESTLGIPVISVGVPTVISANAFCRKICEENQNPSSMGMLVSPKDIDEITRVASEIISGGINLAFGICG